MAERPQPVSEAELEVLKALWERGPGTVRERLQKVSAATADNWDRVTGAVSDAVQDFQKMYDDVRSHFDK